MSDLDDFLAWVGSRLKDAEVVLHNGDAAARLAIWSRHEPVTVLGAWKSARGQQELRDLFTELAEGFSDCTSYSYEVIAADVIGDMAYTVGYEHTRRPSAANPGPTLSARPRSTAARTEHGRSRTDMRTRCPTPRSRPRLGRSPPSPLA